MSVVASTPSHFIAEYGAKTTIPQGIGNVYFFYESDSKIYAWHSGKKTVAFGGCVFSSKDEALRELFDLAVENSSLNSLELLGTEKDDVLKFLTDFLEMAIECEWGDEAIDKIKGQIHQFK